MLILDQRTMQVKYRVPAGDIYRLSLSPYFDDIAVFHVKPVSLIPQLFLLYPIGVHVFRWSYESQIGIGFAYKIW